jgi:hypothetical protein
MYGTSETMYNHLQTLRPFFRFPVGWAAYNGIENKRRIPIYVSKNILFFFGTQTEKLRSSIQSEELYHRRRVLPSLLTTLSVKKK